MYTYPSCTTLVAVPLSAGQVFGWTTATPEGALVVEAVALDAVDSKVVAAALAASVEVVVPVNVL